MNQRSIRVPIRPFPVQDFDTFVGRMLSVPGVEDAIRSTLTIVATGALDDIAQAQGIREVHERWKRKMPTASDNDLLLLWSVSVDWFNPYLNKISGKSVSSESIAMICLLLPPSLRIRQPFIYINGIIPHPEPAEDQVNHFLRPIMSKLDESWRHGVWYSRTYEHPRGRKVHSGIATSVNDLPGSRKVAGHASHSAGFFCALCKLTRDDINNLDMGTWVAKTRDELHEQAIA